MNLRKHSNLLIVLQLVFLTSCMDMSFNFDNHPRGNFEALWKIIDRNYCFFEYKEIDWDKVHTEYSSRITSDMNNESLFKLMGEMLAELRDGHVNLSASHDITRYWEWQENYPSNFDSEIQKHYLKSDYSIASGMRYKILEDNVGYIYYGSFSNDVSDSGLDQILSRMAICKGVIIDVRNNGGGSLSNVEKIASRFFNERTHIGYISHKLGPGHNDFSELFPKYLESSNRIRYQKPVIVLTNRGCYSATNEFVSIMKYAQNATIIGDTTGGGSGLPFSSELPNGWSIRFSASPMFNAAKEHIEFGVEPNIKINMLEVDKNRNRDTIIEKARELLNSRY